jgi:hypothetical protein
MPGGGGDCGVSANENSCAHHVTWSLNKRWRSNSIFNLWTRLIVEEDSAAELSIKIPKGISALERRGGGAAVGS